jgi:hypothetical protein
MRVNLQSVRRRRLPLAMRWMTLGWTPRPMQQQAKNEPSRHQRLPNCICPNTAAADTYVISHIDPRDIYVCIDLTRMCGLDIGVHVTGFASRFGKGCATRRLRRLYEKGRIASSRASLYRRPVRICTCGDPLNVYIHTSRAALLCVSLPSALL